MQGGNSDFKGLDQFQLYIKGSVSVIDPEDTQSVQSSTIKSGTSASSRKSSSSIFSNFGIHELHVKHGDTSHTYISACEEEHQAADAFHVNNENICKISLGINDLSFRGEDTTTINQQKLEDSVEDRIVLSRVDSNSSIRSTKSNSSIFSTFGIFELHKKHGGDDIFEETADVDSKSHRSILSSGSKTMGAIQKKVVRFFMKERDNENQMK